MWVASSFRTEQPKDHRLVCFESNPLEIFTQHEAEACILLLQRGRWLGALDPRHIEISWWVAFQGYPLIPFGLDGRWSIATSVVWTVLDSCDFCPDVLAKGVSQFVGFSPLSTGRLGRRRWFASWPCTCAPYWQSWCAALWLVLGLGSWKHFLWPG